MGSNNTEEIFVVLGRSCFQVVDTAVSEDG